VYDEWDRDISITDGHWIIELGAHGFVGVVSCFTLLLMPLGLLAGRVPAKQLLSRELAPVLALAVVAALFAIDCLPNAFKNPVFTLVGGAVIGYVMLQRNLRDIGTRPEIGGMEERSAASVPARRLHPGSV
jgi:hypothetical protein